MKGLAPIVLFTYNRLWHTKQTIEALQQNDLASKSELFIFNDGWKNQDDKLKVLEVRDYISNINGFKNIIIFTQDKNIGLAASIINGVTTIINQYGKIIVLEDDIVTSSYFLNFMNDALNFYEQEDKVWHISGWNYPIKSDKLKDTFFWRMMNCWGWATWADKWQYFEKNPKKLIQSFSSYEIYKFDLDNSGMFWNQVLKNYKGDMNTWAIFWYATIFQQNGLCLNPTLSYVVNIGFDGSGTNTGVRTNYSVKYLNKSKSLFYTKIIENDLAVYEIKNFLLAKENKNLLFSKNLNIIISTLEKLDKSKTYILYGAGSGAKVILSFFSNHIEYIVDNNTNQINTSLKNKLIYPVQKLRNRANIQIIISVFGREKDICDTLKSQYEVPQNNLITFKLR